jgi:hypothetical protein
MSMTLANYKRYASRLTEAVKSDQLSAEHLKQFIQMSYRTDVQVLLDQVATHFLSFASASLLDKFINTFKPHSALGADGPLFCEKLFTMTLTEEEAMGILVALFKNFHMHELIKVIPEEDYLLIAKLAVEYGIEAIADKFRIEKPTENGFLFDYAG